MKKNKDTLKNKTVGIDLSEDRLLDMASDYLDDHNYLGALRMLNKNSELNGNAEDSYMLYAEAFDDMGLYEKCVNGWYKYIDYCYGYEDEHTDYGAAYEGIAVNFLNMGDEETAAYYYNKLLVETSPELDSDRRKEIIDSFIITHRPTLKIAWPPRLADVSGEMEDGLNFMRAGEYERAKEQFAKVGEGNKSYLAARNYIAMCDIICDKCDEAEQECRGMLEKFPDDIQALTTLAAVKNQQKCTEESRAIARRLLEIGGESTEDRYKIATVCCENNMHAEAYALFCKIEDDLPFDNAVLYFKAVSAYNCGRKRESLEAFDKIQTIYIDAVTAKYYMDFVREHMAEDDEDFLEHPLSYFYRLPQEERESNISLLTAFVMLEPKAAVALSDQLDLSDCIRWCFDEGGENSPEEIKLLGASAAAMAPSCEDIFRDILLDGFLSDRVKIHALAAVAECNRGGEYGVVVCNIYRKIKLPVLSVGRAKRKQFLRAYGVAVARFALIDPDYAYVIKDAATELHARLAANKGFAAVKTPAALAAAICACGGISGVIGEKAGPDEMCAYFAADRKEFDKIMGGAN